MSPNTRELVTLDRRYRSSRIARLFRSAGTVHRVAPRFQGLDTLENRILLAGDHPSFALPLNVANSTVLTLDANGRANDTGVISPAMDDDLFSFVAPADDFVTVWADTLNTASPSTLDSRIEVYAADGTVVASGSSSDLLTGGFNNTGWAGFVATSGETYFVRVMSDVFTGAAATGDYVVRVDAKTDPLTINGNTGRTSGSTTIVLPGEDLVFSMTTPVDDAFDSLATFYGDADPDLFDARIDVYGPDGQRITFDSEAGRLSNPYAVARTQQDTTYYVRVRGDHFVPGDPLALGGVTMNADFASTEAPIDPVNRQILTLSDRVEGVMESARDPLSFVFQSLGTGLHVITTTGVFLPLFTPPLDDPAMHLYDDQGNQLGFNKLGGSAELQIQLNANQRYHIVIESFDNAVPNFPAGAGLAVWVEAHHTWNQGIVAGPVDDHVGLPTFDPQNLPVIGTPEYQQLLDQFGLATPIQWSEPQLLIDPFGNPIGDKSYFVQALARGRIHQSGDSDLFSFVPPTDVLGEYNGDDGNQDGHAAGGGHDGGLLSGRSDEPAHRGNAAHYRPGGGRYAGIICAGRGRLGVSGAVAAVVVT
ncbi:MAG: hypothetical protein IIB55_04720 [Planctomycetes bacterium]|nr:hypothetical protein [Planctomycetota bacterium]